MIKLPDISRLLDPLLRMFPAARPAVAAEIGEDRLVMVRLGRSGTGPRVLAFFVGEIPPGAVRPSAGQPNIPDPSLLAPILQAAREAVAPGGGAIALALPDSAARIAVVAATELPRGRDEQREMIAWRLKKILPYRMEDAQVGSQVFTGASGRHVVMAAAMRRRAVAEYESLFSAHRFEVGCVVPSTLALAALLPAGDGDSLLLHVGQGWFSMLVTDGREPLFFRSKVLPDGERGGQARDAAILAELPPTLEYHASRLNRPPLQRLYLHASVPGCEPLVADLASRLMIDVRTLPGPHLQAPPGPAGYLAPACSLALAGVSEQAGEPADAGAPSRSGEGAAA